MSWFLILLLILFGAGYYAYRRLVKIEREIRTEQQSLPEEPQAPTVSEPQQSEISVSDGSSAGEIGDVLTQQMLDAVQKTPGLTQTELYTQFADADRREIQRKLRALDQQGRLRREKKGSSFQLFPL